MSDFRKAKLGVEDINFDSARNDSTFNRQTSSGGSQQLTKINAKHIPVPSSLSWDDAESVHDFLVKLKDFKDAYDAFIANVGHWDKFLGFFADSATLEATHSAPTDDDVFAWVDSSKSFWHWDQSLGTPAWADSYRMLSDETAPTLNATLSINGNDIDFEDGDGGLINLKKMALTSQATKVINDGSITIDQVLIKVDTEGLSASDELLSIAIGNGVNLFFLELEDDSRVVTLKHGTGTNMISLPNNTDLVMSKGIIYGFVHNGTQSKYIGYYINSFTVEKTLFNIIIDGQFNHWSEGTSFTSDGYSADMWGFSKGGGTATITQQTFTLGQSDVPGNPKYYLQHDQTVNGTGVKIYQRQKGCARFSDSSVTISFYAKVSSGTLNVTPAFIQNFGSGGSPSSSVETLAGSAVTLTTTWTEFTRTIDIPSVSGKTLGTNADSDYFEIALKIDDSETTFTAQIANVALVDSVSAFNGSWLSSGEESQKVSEYYYAHLGEIYAYEVKDAAVNRYTIIDLPRKMAQIPTVSITSSSNYVSTPSWNKVTKNQVASTTSASSSTSIAYVTDIFADARY